MQALATWHTCGRVSKDACSTSTRRFTPGCDVRAESDAAVGQVFDMKRPLELPLHNHARLKELLRGEEDIKVGRNVWRHKEWSVNEQIGFEYLTRASDEYYR